MELLTGRANTVYLEGEEDWDVTSATWRYADSDTPAALDPTDNGGVFSASIPYLDREGEVEVVWTFDVPGITDPIVKTEFYVANTPYLTKRELKEVWPEGTDAELARVESAVRMGIKAYTGQSFGNYNATKTVSGNNSPVLELPDKLLEFTTVEGYRFGGALQIVGGGWYLTTPNNLPFIPPIRQDAWDINSGSHLELPVPIRVPGWMRSTGNSFHTNEQYNITGTWGWRSVPLEVKEAARLLVNDYACGDTIYRDRFLTSMTAADWRIQYNNRAFTGTGNARADQLLAGFVLQRGWAVI